MKKIGFIFPGQGAQTVGMGRDFYEASQIARKVYEEADLFLGFSVSDLCFKGPEELLQQTVNTQIAIFVTCIAILRVIQNEFPKLTPALACGLSIGEFTALVSLNSVSFAHGLKIVKRRGELMEEAAKKTSGTMTSILGLSREACVELCRQTGVQAANFNSPEQTVISGDSKQIQNALEIFKERGAKRVIPLRVGGAFHSSLMASARPGLETTLAQIEIQKPQGIYVSNVTGEEVADSNKIRSLLLEQLTSPVEWVKSMRTAAHLGISELIEVGPGKVLKGLAKRIDSNLNVTSIGSFSDLELLAQTVVGS